MKKLLSLVIVFSLALVLYNVSFADEGVEVSVPVEQSTAVEDGIIAQGCHVPYYPCGRPFVRRSCTPCVANPCTPCPPQPSFCAPLPHKLCGAPIQSPCFAEQAADPCGCGYPAPRPGIRGLFSRLLSRSHGGYGYGEPEFGYGVESGCSCGR